MAYHTMSAYMKTYKNVNVFQNYSAGTIFKARHKIIMKSCKHNTVSNRNKYITLSGKLQQQKTRGILFLSKIPSLQQLFRPEFLSQPALYFPVELYFLGSDNDLDLYTCPSK